MLGRLRMSVDECIHEYEKFMNQVFTNTWREAAENLVNVTKYNTSKLENVLRGVIKERTKNEDEPLLDEGNECKVYDSSLLLLPESYGIANISA